MQEEIKKCAVVFAPDMPGENSGYEIAIKSILEVYKELFPEIHLIVFNQNKEEKIFQKGQVITHLISFNKQEKWIRFFKSLFNRKPASIQHFNSGYLKNELTSLLHSLKGLKDPFIIFEDIPLAQFNLLVKEIFPRSKTLVRSHNVLSEAFIDFEGDNNTVLNMAWSMENKKIKKFEETVLKKSDYFFAITDNDYQKYQELFHQEIDGVLSIGFDEDRYDSVQGGNIENILYLGTADLRKGHGLKVFLDSIWPKINEIFPNVNCILGGKYTDELTDKNNNIFGYGFIHDEKDFLSGGKIFINPQERGSGINLKSITAMLASKVLVSTPKGIEGINGIDGKHYIVAETAQEFSDTIIDLIKNPQTANDIGTEACTFAKKNFSINSLKKKAVPKIKKILF